MRNGPAGESETATAAIERAYVLPPGSVRPSACHHMTHCPVLSLCSTLGRSKIAV